MTYLAVDSVADEFTSRNPTKNCEACERSEREREREKAFPQMFPICSPSRSMWQIPIGVLRLSHVGYFHCCRVFSDNERSIFPVHVFKEITCNYTRFWINTHLPSHLFDLLLQLIVLINYSMY